MSKNDDLFLLWLYRRKLVLSMDGENDEAEWKALIAKQKSFISKKLVDYMPDTVNEVKEYLKLHFEPQQTVMDYLDFLVSVIEDFASGEYRLLVLIDEVLRVEGNRLQMGYYLLQRQDMLDYLNSIDENNFTSKKMVTFVLAGMVDKIINGGDCGESDGWLHNSFVPRLFMAWAETLKNKYPTVFMIVSDALPEMLKFWKLQYENCGIDDFNDCCNCWEYYTSDYSARLKSAYGLD